MQMIPIDEGTSDLPVDSVYIGKVVVDRRITEGGGSVSIDPPASWPVACGVADSYRSVSGEYIEYYTGSAKPWRLHTSDAKYGIKSFGPGILFS